MKLKFWTVLVVAVLLVALVSTTVYVANLKTTSASSFQQTSTIWPLASSHETFTDLTTAATSVATDFAHMKDVVIDNSARVSPDTWEVLLQSGASGPRTRVYLVQRPADHTWWVTSATAQDIVLGTPKWQTEVANPFRVTGLSTAFEATVNGTLLSRETGTVLKEFTTMGGANGIVGAFSKSISVPATALGAKTMPATILLYEISAKDGSVMEFSASPLRIRASH